MSKHIYIFCLCVLVTWLGCAKKPSSYYPLEEGKSWEYQLSTISLSGGIGETKLLMTNQAKRELFGRTVVPKKVDFRNQSMFLFIAEDQAGIYYFAEQSARDVEPKVKEPPDYIIPYPVETGRMWQTETTTQLLGGKKPITLESTLEIVDETITVPAGTFEKCIKVVRRGSTKNDGRFMHTAIITVEEYSWYARGVGLVKSIRKEQSWWFGSGEISLQLVKFR